MFRSMDRDDNGFIDCQELMTSFAALGVPLTDEDVKAMLQEAGIKGQKIFFKGAFLLEGLQAGTNVVCLPIDINMPLNVS